MAYENAAQMRPWSQRLFHLIVRDAAARPADHDDAYFRRGFAETAKFVRRFDGAFNVRDRTVLDLGCGFGSTVIALAQSGARKVVGVDIDGRRIAYAQRKLRSAYPQLADRVSFYQIGSFNDLDTTTHDLIISKDSFEHYDNPEEIPEVITPRLTPGGRIAIGFGPLWKSPYGGHISYMTRLPWAHLLFPEVVIMRERRRYIPDDPAEEFGAITGGLNKMTLARFSAIMRGGGLRPTYFRTAISDHPLTRPLSLLAQLPPTREYGTFNVYSIWERAD